MLFLGEVMRVLQQRIAVALVLLGEGLLRQFSGLLPERAPYRVQRVGSQLDDMKRVDTDDRVLGVRGFGRHGLAECGAHVHADRLDRGRVLSPNLVEESV